MNRNKTLEGGAGALHRPAIRTPHHWKPSTSPGASGEFVVGPDAASQRSPTEGAAVGVSGVGRAPGELASGERTALEVRQDPARRQTSAERPVTRATELSVPLLRAEDEDPPGSWEPIKSSDLSLTWDYVMEHERVPVEIQLRALVQALKSLELLHLGALGSTPARAHGALCLRKLMFHTDGAAFCVLDDESRDQPARYVAPELSHGHRPDRASDVFAVGVMVLEALTGLDLTPRDIWGVYLEDVHAHAFWARYAHDPLVFVALRAIAVRPQARWASAGEFAYALIRAGAERVASVPALADVLRDSVRHSEDRATPVMASQPTGFFEAASLIASDAEALALEESKDDSENVSPDEEGTDAAWELVELDGAIGDASADCASEPAILADADVLDDAEMVSLLPYEPGSWRIARGADTEVMPSRAARPSCPTLVDLPGTPGVLDWSDFRESESKLVHVEHSARHSNTLVSPPPQGLRSPWRRRVALMLLVSASGGGAVAFFGVERLSSSLRLVFAELSRVTGSQGTDGDAASAPSRVGQSPADGTAAPAVRAEPAEVGGAPSASVEAQASAAPSDTRELAVAAPGADVAKAPKAAASTKPQARPKKRPAKPPRKSQPPTDALEPDLEQSIFGKRL